MPLFLLKIARWLLSKSVFFILVGALAVAGFALWLFAQQSYRTENRQEGDLSALQERVGEVYVELESVHRRLIELGERIDETQRRIEAANSVISYLDGILRRISRFITLSAAERAESERQLAEARAVKEEQERRQNELIAEQSRLRVNRVQLNEEAKDLEAAISEMERASTRFAQNIEDAWSTLKPYLLVALAGAVLLPLLWKLFAFFIWAPLLSLAGPIRLVKLRLPPLGVSSSGVSIQVALEEGQRVWVKESYLQASDESLSRHTRFVLSWAIPATCLAAGLVELIELSCKNGRGRVTVSPQKRAELEVAVIEIPAGGQLVARPSSVAGIISRNGEPVRIERRWRIFHPQAWLTFQFRYFIFQGPCALIVSGVRGVRFEVLDTEANRGRRSNQIATIGFTPDLAYGVARAETFWSYFRGFNPLFDDVFRGQGVFLCQEISQEVATKASRFWANLWSSLLKILGV